MSNETLTIIIALGGWIIAFSQAYIAYIERQQKRNDDLLLRTVEYFKGNAQERNIGISLVEGLSRRSNKKQLAVIVPLLTNQFVYLLIQAEDTSANEERNLVRIFFLLEKFILPNHKEFHNERIEILEAIGRRIHKDYPESSALNIPDTTLQLWMRNLDFF